MNYLTIQVDFENGVGTLTLNRPERRNAMNLRMHAEISDFLIRTRFDPSFQVLVIRGAGDAAFCSGMDLEDTFVPEAPAAETLDRAYTAAQWRLTMLPEYPKATIAEIHGYCFGGAFGIVEACDLAFAAHDATFGLSEINFMMFPGGPVSYSLARAIPAKKALYYALSGDTFDGMEAEKIGLVTSSVPRAGLSAHVNEVARKLSGKDAHALRLTKEAFRYSSEMSPAAAISYSVAKQAELTVRQGDKWRAAGVGGFLAGEYRPGLESHHDAKDSSS